MGTLQHFSHYLGQAGGFGSTGLVQLLRPSIQCGSVLLSPLEVAGHKTPEKLSFALTLEFDANFGLSSGVCVIRRYLAVT